MFPLGWVLFPTMPLHLRVFEDRYLAMLADILPEEPEEPAEFGVVLIERGHEVGGGEYRFMTGTVAEVKHLQAEEGFVGLVAVGSHRIEVVEWLDDVHYPRALVRRLPQPRWDDAWQERLDSVEALVRRTLARASEFDDQQWPATVELSTDPVDSLWELAAIAPIESLDKVRLLDSVSVTALLDRLESATRDADEALDARSWNP